MQVVGLAPTHDGVAVRRRVDYLTVEFALYPRLTGRQHLDRFAHVRGLSDLRCRDERFSAEQGRPVRASSKRNRQQLPRPVAPWLHPARFASPFLYAVGAGQLTGACLAAFDHLDVR